jgi:hypothetical protein
MDDQGLFPTGLSKHEVFARYFLENAARFPTVVEMNLHPLSVKLGKWIGRTRRRSRSGTCACIYLLCGGSIGRDEYDS